MRIFVATHKKIDFLPSDCIYTPLHVGAALLSKDGTVIEIQTANLSKLYPKISDAISKNHKCIIVHPIIVKKNSLFLIVLFIVPV